MSRLSFRYTVTGELTAESALHVGGLGQDGTVDLGQVRDGLGRVVIPGTSLAGVIRAALPNGYDDDVWWGTRLSGDPERDREAHASRITVFDAPAKDDVVLEVRDGVSIDRVTGAAAHRHLFSRSVVPAGTTFKLELLVDVPTGGLLDEARQRVDEIVALLCGPGLTVGAAATRGLGQIKLCNPTVRREDFTSPGGLLTALTQNGTACDLPTITNRAAPSGVLRITVPWKPLGPVMSKVADEAGHADAFPAVTRDASAIRLVIPGSSLKGTLRTHAERVLRTLRKAPLDTEDFVEQMQLSAKLPAIGDLFGAAGNLLVKDEGRRGLLRVADVTSSVALPRREWDRVRAGGVPQGGPAGRPDDDQARRALAQAVKKLNECTAPHGLWFDIASRNAIDRWTGGAADRLLYTTVEPYAVGPDPWKAWTPLVLDLDIARARRSGASAVSVDALLALILLLLRDFAEGWIPIGFGNTRGLGAVRADPKTVTFTFPGEPSDTDRAAALHGKTLEQLFGDDTITGPIERAWEEVILCPASTSTASS